MTTGHSRLPPSSAARRVACPGSRVLEAKYPQNPDSPHAREGDTAHWVASEMLKGVGDMGMEFPTVAPNGELITYDMLEGAEIYHDCVATVLNKRCGFYDVSQLHIEKRLDISSIHPDCWGTPDCWAYVGNEIFLWDYKFGHGYVEVFENWQLIEYAAGIIQYLGINGLVDQHTFITFYIVQPRAYHRDGQVREWRTRLSDLRGLFNILRDAEAVASHSFGGCFVSPECKYCSARHVCETLQRSALSTVDQSTINIPLELSEKEMGNELKYMKRAASLLDARITGLEEQITALLMRGKYIPHFALEQSKGRDAWKKSVNEVVTLGEMFGIDLAKPQDVITPKQAIKAGIPQSVVATYTEHANGSLKLAEVQEQHARKIFGGVK